MMDAIQVWPQLMTVAGDLVARAQDWPGADKIAERLEQSLQGAQVDPEQMQKMQEELQKLQMENATLTFENKSKEDKTEVDITNAATQRITSYAYHEVDANHDEMNTNTKNI